MCNTKIREYNQTSKQFFQENMNEPGTRRSDTSTAIAYYIFLNRNTCSGKHLCIVPTHALINRKCINLMFRCCNQAMLTSISLQHGINSEIHFIIILFLNITVNQYIINKKFTHLKNLYLFSLPSMKPKDKEIDLWLLFYTMRNKQDFKIKNEGKHVLDNDKVQLFTERSVATQ